jgi:hypothetical protein
VDSLQSLPVAFWIALLVLGGFALSRALEFLKASGSRRRHGAPPRRTGGKLQPPSLTDPLLNACLGDSDKAERLTRRELRITPGISRLQARERAFQRILRDRS